MSATSKAAASKVYSALTFRLYTYVLSCLSNHNYTGLDLFYKIKDCWKQRDEPYDLLTKPLEVGLSSKIGQWCFAEMFSVESSLASGIPDYFKTLSDEEFVWFLDDVVEAVSLLPSFHNLESIKSISEKVIEVSALYESDEEEYYSMIAGTARVGLISMFKDFCETETGCIQELSSVYAPEIADRILHDRSLCHFISERVLDIGFDGDQGDGLKRQWVNREQWPARVKEILVARDRGKCARCGVDITQELRAKQHIDHMFPISKGGCNDLTNLQILCEGCNLQKLNLNSDTSTSIPKYIRRK